MAHEQQALKLMNAVGAGNLSQCKEILASAPSVEEKNKMLFFQNNFGWTALMKAALYGHESIAGFLLSQTSGAQEKSKMLLQNDINGDLALHFAAYEGNENVVRTLLSASDVEVASKMLLVRNNEGKTPRDVAASKKHHGVTKLLDEAKAATEKALAKKKEDEEKGPKEEAHPSVSSAQPASPTAGGSATWDIGDCVQLHGLKAAPQHNGRVGTVLGLSPNGSGRWRVQSVDDVGEPLFLDLKECNLRKPVVQDCDYDLSKPSAMYVPIIDFVKNVTPNGTAKEVFENEVVPALSSLSRWGKWLSDEAVKVATSIMESGKNGLLTPAQVYAVALYTLDVQPQGGREENFYYLLNAALQKRDPVLLKSLEGYLHYFMGALEALVPEPERIFFRGLPKGAYDVVKDNYSSGQRIHWSGMTSLSEDESKSLEFALKDGKIGADGRGGVLFRVTARSGRSIAHLSPFPEREVLLLPNFAGVVTRNLYRDGDVWAIDIVEMKPAKTYVF